MRLFAGLCRPSAVIFDWDKTLVESCKAVLAAVNLTFRDLGIGKTWTMTEVQRYMHREDALQIAFGDMEDEGKRIFYQYSDVQTETMGLDELEGASATLDILSRCSVPMSIVSNKREQALKREITQMGWDSYFVNVIGRRSGDFCKPNIAPFAPALHNIPVDISHVWMVGDSNTDMEFARRVGIHAVQIGNTASKITRGQHWHFQDHTQLQKSLMGMLEQSYRDSKMELTIS